MDWRDYIVSKPGVCHGKPCIKGTRVMVTVILDCVSEGMSEAEIMAEYPTVSANAIRASVAYAAELLQRR